MICIKMRPEIAHNMSNLSAIFLLVRAQLIDKIGPQRSRLLHHP